MARSPSLEPLSLPILLEARRRLVAEGWGRSEHPERWTLTSAVADGSISGWRALELLRWLAGDRNLVTWNDSPVRTGTEVVALIDRAIRELGGTPPRVAYREPRRRGGRAGGWTITTTPARTTRESWQGSEGLGPASHRATSGSRSSLFDRATEVPCHDDNDDPSGSAA